VSHPVSAGKLCITGWNATPALFGADRLQTPLIRRTDHLEPASWDEAISFTASALRRISSDGGSQRIGIVGSAKTTNEECYSLVKFARSVMGTPNIDGACRFYDASAIYALLETTGTPASDIDLNSVPQAGSMLVVGANVMDQLAHVGSRIHEAADNGCRIVAADPRTSRLAPFARLFIRPIPGTDLIWLRALIKTILDQKLYVEAAPEMAGFDELRASLTDLAMDQLEGACGVDTASIIEAADILAHNPPLVVMFGLGVLQQPNSTQLARALADVAILLGGSVMPLRGQNNIQGACDVGLAHDLLPGYGLLTDPYARRTWEGVWGCKLPSEPGMSSADMIRVCGSGELKALMVFGENVVLSAPGTEQSRSALGKVDFLAVADLYLTETARLADVVFPACSFLEKDGTFTNIERRVQRVRKVTEPVGQSRSDLDIIADLASALGTEMPRNPAQVAAEIFANVSQYKGLSWDALDKSPGTQWSVARGPLPKLALPSAAEAQVNKDFPFRLIASRIHYHCQTGTMAARCPVLAREYPDTYAELNERDAEELGLRPGGLIKISSPSGSLTRLLILSDSLPPGCVHVPHFFGGDSSNTLASYDCDPISGVPAYKATPVKVEAVR
jgi:formate dehydrogenase major subunit